MAQGQPDSQVIRIAFGALEYSPMQSWYRWFTAAVLAGAVYACIGVGFAPLRTPSVFFWRLAAWVVSAIVYASHICYEHFRLRHPPRSAALHVAIGAGVGAFGLAAAATVRSLLIGRGNLHLLRLALVLWPVITGIPAFLVALTSSSIVARLQRQRPGIRPHQGISSEES